MTFEEFVEELEKSCGISISIEQYDNDSTIQLFMKVDGGVDDIFMEMESDGSEIYFLNAFGGLNNSQKTDVLRVLSDYIRDLSEKKYKYKLPKFLCKGIRCYLVRDLNDDRFVISYGILSDDFQAHFTDEEMKNLIEEHGEDFRKFIELCEPVEGE